MDKFVTGEVYISKCVDTLLDRTPCFVTTDQGKFRVNGFRHDNSELDEYILDKGNHNTIVFASDTYDAVDMDGIRKAREKWEAANDRRSQVQA